MSLLTESRDRHRRATVSVGETADAAIDCRNVSVRFVTDRRVVTAFDNVSFTVGRGRIPQRCSTPPVAGKSTLLRVVRRPHHPSKGTVNCSA